MSQIEKKQLQLGYIPLLDCIALLWAKERGYFAEMGLDVTLVKEASWASLRDRLAFGILDAAHCLSAMLPAAAIGEDQIGIPLKTPLVLSKNRAYISLSQKLCYGLSIQNADNAQESSAKLVTYLEQEQSIALAHVFHHSIHHYCLREWLALSHLDLAKAIQLKTLPPPYMLDALASASIDGFCVGEPWNTQGEIEGYSQIVASSRDIIPEVTDKVLAVTEEWAAHHPHTVIALTAAILKAQQELETLSDLEPVWQILINFNIVRFQCSKSVHVKSYHALEQIIRHLVVGQAAPCSEDMIWLFGQMQKWHDLTIETTAINELSQRCIDRNSFEKAMQRLQSNTD